MWFLFLLACRSSSPTFRVVVSEAFDVPPPPDQRTLRLVGPHPHPVDLGSLVPLNVGEVRTHGDVVDHTDDPAELIVYVPEDPAQDLLDAGTLLLR